MEKIVTPKIDLLLLHFPNSRKFTSIPSPTLRFPSFNRHHKKRPRLTSSSRLEFEAEIETDSESYGVIIENSNVRRRLLGIAAAAAVAVTSSMCCDSSALAESLTIAFPVSRAREVIKLFN